MSWPTDLSGYGSLVASRSFLGVTEDLWKALVDVVGDPKDDYRLLAALPSTVVQAAIEATILPNVDPISLVQAAQLGLVYHLAKREQHGIRFGSESLDRSGSLGTQHCCSEHTNCRGHHGPEEGDGTKDELCSSGGIKGANRSF